MKKVIAVVLLAVFVTATLLLTAGCGKQIKEDDLSYAGPMLDNVLAGIKDKDYAEFTKDFSSKLASAFTEDSFKSFADMISDKIGDYDSRTFAGGQNTKSNGVDMTVVGYKAKYTKESGDVIITVTFGDENGVRKIMGFYMNSPNLRK